MDRRENLVEGRYLHSAWMTCQPEWELTMQIATNRYFFDRVSRQRSEYDYRGHELPNLEKALQLAELIALDLGLGDGSEWTGWTVDVRNAHGQIFFSIPVRATELAAA